jgi:hypothetical protein
MTKVTGNVDVSAFTTDAKFRAWGSANSTALASAGLVQTADTGQINWTTVTKPGVASTKAGYEIWKFNDSLAGSKPVFIKFEYGTNGGTSSGGVWVSVGTGSNGSGTLTGPVAGPYVLNTNVSAWNNTAMTYMHTHSLTNGYLLANFGMSGTAGSGIGTSVAPMVCIVERTKDSTGTPTSNGVALYMVNEIGSGTIFCSTAMISFDTNTVLLGTVTTAGTTTPMFIGATSLNQSLSSGSNVILYRNYIYGGSGSLFYSTGALAYYNTDIVNGSTFSTVPVGTTSHTYYAWNVVRNATSAGTTGGSDPCALAWLWED